MQFKNWLLSESDLDLQIGKIFDIPGQAGRSPFHVQIINIKGDSVILRRITKTNPPPDIKDDMAGGNPFKMTRASVKHFINDLSGKVEVRGKSDDPWINKVLNGEATYLGKGDDGVVYDAGEMIVKISTTVPFHPDSTAQRNPVYCRQNDLYERQNDRTTPKRRCSRHSTHLRQNNWR